MFDVAGMGSALMDFTIEADDKLLDQLELKKGNMHLIDEASSRKILDKIKDYRMIKTPGGSAANTVAGVAALGGKSVFIGKIGNDTYGDLYRDESEKMGVVTRLGRHERLTGHAITFITPDSERTFATHLGAALYFRKQDIDEKDIKNSKILHIEGYLLEDPDLKAASIYAMEIAKANKVKISVDLADPSLIKRNLGEFKKLMKEFTDIIFVNEEEAISFSGTAEEQALKYLSEFCDIAVVKLGAKGSIIGKGANNVYKIPSYKTSVVNTNGAGDMYAAGFLYALARNYPLERAGRIASYVASLVVAQVGARLSEKPDINQIGT